MNGVWICIALIAAFIAVTAIDWRFNMKHGKNPTRSQRMEIKANRLNPENWLVTKDTPDCLELVHRYQDGNIRKIVRDAE